MPLKNRGRWPSGKETIKMPIMLTRKDGPPTPFRNAEYIPFYYFIPKSILSRCGAELNHRHTDLFQLLAQLLDVVADDTVVDVHICAMIKYI